MYLCYIDESGVEQTVAHSDHFVLLGLSIPVDKWKRFDHEVESIKAKYDLRGIEIHTAVMMRDYVEQKDVKDFEKLLTNQRIEAAEQEIRKRSGVIGVSGKKNKVKS